jgi:hypothetical protein
MANALAEMLAEPMICSFHAVAVGQFRGLDYGPGAPSGSSSVVVAASVDDLEQRRAALIEQSGAAVARVVMTAKQALLISVNPNGDTASLTLFLSARKPGGVPAGLSRQTMIGSAPVLVQSTGACRSAPGPR